MEVSMDPRASETSPLLADGGSAGFGGRLSESLAKSQAESQVAKREDGSPYPLSAPVDSLGKLGMGVGLYFNFVFYFAFAMGLLALLSIPALVVNSMGGAAYDATEGLSGLRAAYVSWTLGNVREHSVLVHAILDTVCTLAVTAFLLKYRSKQEKSRQEIEARHITAADYTIWAQNLPANTTEEQLQAFFAKYGELSNTSIALDNADQMAQIRRKDELLEEIEHLQAEQEMPERVAHARKAMAKARRELDVVNEQLQDWKHRQGRIDCCGHAFVTFTLESSALMCLEEMCPKRNWLGIQQPLTRPEVCVMNGTPISVTRAPQASDVEWESLPFSSVQRGLRKAGTSLVSFILVLFATALIAAVNGKHIIFPVTKTPLIEAVGLNVVTVIVILGANVMLFIAIPALANFEKHLTRSERERHVMLRLYFFQVFNTIIAAAILWDASEKPKGGADWAHWFADGGYLVFNVLIGDALLMNFIEIWRPFDVVIPRKVAAKKACTQRRLNKLWSPPEFSLGMRFQMCLKTITVAWFFGPGIPILYFVAAASLTLEYWIDKYNVLRVFKKPAQVDAGVPFLATAVVLPFALLLHCITACFMYSVVVECPNKPICAVKNNDSILALFLMLASGGAVVTAWPLLLRKPSVQFEMVRAREAPYHSVRGIDSYMPPFAGDEDADKGRKQKSTVHIIDQGHEELDGIGVSVSASDDF